MPRAHTRAALGACGGANNPKKPAHSNISTVVHMAHLGPALNPTGRARTGVGVAPHDRLRPSFQLDMAGAPMSEAEHTPLAEHNNPPARKRSSVSSFNMPQRLHSLGGDSIAEDAGDAAELAPSSADDSADDLWCISLNGRMFEVSTTAAYRLVEHHFQLLPHPPCKNAHDMLPLVG